MKRSPSLFTMLLSRHTRRREFITLLGSAAVAWPLAAHAQQMRLIGVLISIEENDPEAQARATAFRQGMQELGWVDGRNVRIDYRYVAGDVGRAER
jgi:putative ABC transport system substrate-binding protein